METTTIRVEKPNEGGFMDVRIEGSIGVINEANKPMIKLADMLANCSDSPAGKMMERIGRNLSYLTSNRKLTGTQEKLVRELRELFEEYNMAF